MTNKIFPARWADTTHKIWKEDVKGAPKVHHELGSVTDEGGAPVAGKYCMCMMHNAYILSHQECQTRDIRNVRPDPSSNSKPPSPHDITVMKIMK